VPLRNVSAHRECNSESGQGRDGLVCRERSGPMSEKTHAQVPLEPERYELKAATPYRFDLDRRDFFKFLGGGLLVVSILKPAMVAQESGGGRQRRRDLPKEINAWLHLDEDGK